MEVYDGNTVWIAAFFPIEGMDVQHLEVARLVCGKWGVKGCHLACALKGDDRMFIGSIFCGRNKIPKVFGNFNTSNDIRDKSQL